MRVSATGRESLVLQSKSVEDPEEEQAGGKQVPPFLEE